jgi:hypothetical protein
LKLLTLNKSHLKMPKIDFSNINANEEEIFYLIQKKLDNIPSNEIINFYEFKEKLHDLLKEAKKTDKIKKHDYKSLRRRKYRHFYS